MTPATKAYCSACRHYIQPGQAYRLGRTYGAVQEHLCEAVREHYEVPGNHLHPPHPEPIYRDPPKDNANNDCPDYAGK